MESRLKKSGGIKRHWVTEAINFVNEHLPAFKDVFDKDTFYKFVLFVLIASALFVFLMVRVFKVRVCDHCTRDVLRERQPRDWRPANPFRFPWQIDANKRTAAKRCHTKGE
ncbi:hypothetical protein niasHT_028151 [Heterodera trifolii]|uniref:Uncharacterized protein n=1 Tax=Heterodera trifolii TaxID=157864 RepID=A0ABD2JP94_9BILA